ncbi:hypothetical protein EAL2_c03150 [Peptoclostridium acidaminophilum DSM 3953]|uniref:FlgN family protein n=1 Tax=Peptoclostridium acidaminophilum DSM 3953 TaxID=1286171 RepID=W8TCT7_PEPAC|nr:flagellar protein FlgN [Peptoclostridium acidaminophilum]AHM55618.1 hypothetical protein EAL2_c03150 [Peptoclostridium acidaminophilum DSM 3953]
MEGIDSFIRILGRQLELNRALLEISIEKTDAIRSDDSKRLSGMLVDEQEMVKEMISLEKERGSVTSAIGKDSGAKTVDDILSIVGAKSEQKAKEIEGIAAELRQVLRELEERNSMNNSLLQFTIDYIDLNVNLMTSSREPANYGRGSKTNPAQRSMFDSKY